VRIASRCAMSRHSHRHLGWMFGFPRYSQAGTD
jgi:hypothetical protein